MALLLGSDYTEGIAGIGPVNALEVARAFPGMDGLKRFRDWVTSTDVNEIKRAMGEDVEDSDEEKEEEEEEAVPRCYHGAMAGAGAGSRGSGVERPAAGGRPAGPSGGPAGPPPSSRAPGPRASSAPASAGPSSGAAPDSDDVIILDGDGNSDGDLDAAANEAAGLRPGGEDTQAQRAFKRAHRKVRKVWSVPDDFPPTLVVQAYESPNVDSSKEEFEWGKPDVAQIRQASSRIDRPVARASDSGTLCDALAFVHPPQPPLSFLDMPLQARLERRGDGCTPR